jgi:uncharacterized protein (TIGR02246 family)
MRQAVVVVVVALSQAGALLPAAAAQGSEADHEELRALRDRLAEAVGKLDADALAPLFTKDFTVTMADQTHVATVAELKSFFESRFRASDSPVTAVRIQPDADVLTHFLDDKTAVNWGRSRDTYTLRRGGEVVLDSRWTATFCKEDGHWKFAAIHAGVNMLDNPILTAASSGKYVWGMGALVIGLIVGMFMARRKRAAA